MRYFPLFLDLKDHQVVVVGGGQTAVSKLRLLLKTEAAISVFSSDPVEEICAWAREGRLTLHGSELVAEDLAGARLLYAAHEDDSINAVAADLARAAGILVNVVDTQAECDFLTPAIVDRDPVVVAIGSEGNAPMLARKVKAQVEASLNCATGELARLAGEWRGVVECIPKGAARRKFWARWFEKVGPSALALGEEAARSAFDALIAEICDAVPATGRIDLVGAGPGDPELLTMKARRLLDEADLVIHDRLVSPQILELARREAQLIEVGKSPYGKSWKQEDINALLIEEASKGQRIVRLKSGDPGIFGRLDEEVAALEAAGVAYGVVPGITAASAGAAELGSSLTRRGRNKSLRFLTGHDIDGFAEQDWRSLAEPGATAAIYMGVRAARFIQGRLLMHGASTDTPVTIVENISRSDRRQLVATLATLPGALADSGIKGPAVLYLGIAARETDQSGAQTPTTSVQTG